ncbi:hypothetical protein P12x_005888 [Tundrisphaera lichenicola]|uniref:anti-sigma factor family protein n=1 Tax=Tundrisphaera lichenicola TaxID=2029860 RepID=UPI003EBDD346
MNGPSRLLRILALRCEEASALASRERDEPLGLVDRLALRGHLLVCLPCRRFRRQILILGDAHRLRGRLETAESGQAEGRLPPEARTRMEEAIRQALRDRPGSNGQGDSASA